MLQFCLANMALAKIYFFGLLILATWTSSSAAAAAESSFTKDNDWDYMLFVHRWPASVCVDESAKQAGKVQCVIPSQLSPQEWVMHGVWPTKAGTEGPVNCDPKLPWDPTALNPLLGDLLKYWPNMEANTPYDSFWKHEYVKHGSCALNFPPLVGEMNFFTKPLQLRQHYQLYQSLASQNIAPSDDGGRTFTHDQILDALQKVYGKRGEVWCGYEKQTKKHYIQEIRFCLDKSFTMLDCPNEDAPTSGKNVAETARCPRTVGLNYPPLNTTNTTPNRRLNRRIYLSRSINL